MAGYYMTWMADEARAAGLTVVELDGWKTRGHGGLSTQRPTPVRHHDASPRGDKLGVPRYMAGNIDRRKKVGDANVWIDRLGRVWMIAAGKTYHAGVTRLGKPGNATTIGEEMDLTVGEQPTEAMTRAVQVFESVVLRHGGHSSGMLEFHKSICFPPGRKVDPYSYDLATERIKVGGILAGAKVDHRVTATVRTDVAPGWRRKDLPYIVDKGKQTVTISAGLMLKVFRVDMAAADGVKGHGGRLADEHARLMLHALWRMGLVTQSYRDRGILGTAAATAYGTFAGWVGEPKHVTASALAKAFYDSGINVKVTA